MYVSISINRYTYTTFEGLMKAISWKESSFKDKLNIKFQVQVDECDILERNYVSRIS